MHKHMHCAVCGQLIHANSEDEIVRRAQEHMQETHNTQISREEVLRQAHEAHH
jgi:predicted small metal-binding protein